MRSVVYRNLDKPFQILGFNTQELVMLVVLFVVGGEVASFIGLSKFWPLMLTVLVGGTIQWFRYSLGEHFLKKLFRFWELPKELLPRVFRYKKKEES